MARQEFPSKVKTAALERSGGRCEAIGPRYGYASGERCQRAVRKGAVNFEHYPRGAHDPSPETRSLANCTAVCAQCNQYAANHTDKQVEQQIKNLSYDHALHQARMARKAGLDVADPVKPRGRQGKHKSIPRPKNFKWTTRPFPRRNP